MFPKLMDRFMSGRFLDTPVFFILWRMLSRNEWLITKTEVLWEKMVERGLDELEWMDRVWEWWREVLEFFQPENSLDWNVFGEDDVCLRSWWEVLEDIYEDLVIDPILEKLEIDEREFRNMAHERWVERREEKRKK